MPYTFESFSVVVEESGTYSLEADWDLPLRSENSEAYLYNFPTLRYEILSFPETLIDQSNDQYPFYFQFAEVKLWSGLDGNYLDSFYIQHKRGFYNKAGRFNILPFAESGQIAVREMSIKFNYNPSTIMLIFTGSYIFID